MDAEKLEAFAAARMGGGTAARFIAPLGPTVTSHALEEYERIWRGTTRRTDQGTAVARLRDVVGFARCRWTDHRQDVGWHPNLRLYFEANQLIAGGEFASMAYPFS